MGKFIRLANKILVVIGTISFLPLTSVFAKGSFELLPSDAGPALEAEVEKEMSSCRKSRDAAISECKKSRSPNKCDRLARSCMKICGDIKKKISSAFENGTIDQRKFRGTKNRALFSEIGDIIDECVKGSPSINIPEWDPEKYPFDYWRADLDQKVQ